MGEVTRAEFNGLGERVNELTNHFVACKAGKEAEIDNLKQITNDTKVEISNIYNKLDNVEEKLSTLLGKVTSAVAIAVTVIGILMKFIPGAN